MARLKEKYQNEIKDAMTKKFSYKNVMEIPKLDKIVINMGVGEAKDNAKLLESAVADLEKITGQTLENVDFTEVRGMEGVKEATYAAGDRQIKVAVASGTKNAKTLMEQVKNGTSEYQFIEIMACPGGCINGGGQPIVPASVRNFEDYRSKRASVLYTLDKNNENRKSHENSAIKRVYDEFFGEPGSHKAHEVLHTTYVKRGRYNN